MVYQPSSVARLDSIKSVLAGSIRISAGKEPSNEDRHPMPAFCPGSQFRWCLHQLGYAGLKIRGNDRTKAHHLLGPTVHMLSASPPCEQHYVELLT